MAEDHEAQKPKYFPRLGPEFVERQRVAQERAAQRVRSLTEQNDERCPRSGVCRHCMEDSLFCQF